MCLEWQIVFDQLPFWLLWCFGKIKRFLFPRVFLAWWRSKRWRASATWMCYSCMFVDSICRFSFFSTFHTCLMFSLNCLFITFYPTILLFANTIFFLWANYITKQHIRFVFVINVSVDVSIIPVLSWLKKLSWLYRFLQQEKVVAAHYLAVPLYIGPNETICWEWLFMAPNSNCHFWIVESRLAPAEGNFADSISRSNEVLRLHIVKWKTNQCSSIMYV